jgi:MFS family permease
LLVFTSSAAILILELVAERIIAPQVGVSLYTWTGIIGVVLAGMSIGYFLGGKVADRWPSRRLLGAVFFAGGVLSMGILAGADWQGFAAPALPLIPRLLLIMTGLFFAPAAVLGMVSPLVAKLALREVGSAGRTIGGIYAAGTAGSIAGTVLTGFVFVPLFDTHVIVYAVALLLTGVGLTLMVWPRRRVPAVGATDEAHSSRDEGKP